MKNFKKSNTLLIIGSIYGVILAGFVIAFAIASMRPVTFQSDPLTSFFSLYIVVMCAAIIMYGLASLTGVVFAIISMNQHKRRLYRICLILSYVTINPLSIFGSLKGIDTVMA